MPQPPEPSHDPGDAPADDMLARIQRELQAGRGEPSQERLPDGLHDELLRRIADAARPEDHPEAEAVIQAHLEARATQKREARTPEPARASETRLQLQHLAARARKRQPPPPAGGGRVVLRHTLESLAEPGVRPGLARLAASIQHLVPEGPGVGGIVREGAKQVIMNQLNPVMAASMAAAETATRLKTLRRWNELGAKERVVNVAGLMGSLADIVGALTPPPASVAASALGAGMSLVMLAGENSEAIHKVATGATGPLAPHKPAESPAEPGKVAAKLEEWGDNLSHNLLDRWQQLTARVGQGFKKLGPTPPPEPPARRQKRPRRPD